MRALCIDITDSTIYLEEKKQKSEREKEREPGTTDITVYAAQWPQGGVEALPPTKKRLTAALTLFLSQSLFFGLIRVRYSAQRVLFSFISEQRAKSRGNRTQMRLIVCYFWPSRAKMGPRRISPIA